MGNEELIWQENFDSGEIDRKEWSFEKGYIRNNELQSYEDSSENAFIRDGQLVLRALKTDNPQKPFTSASINTRYGRHFLYGRIEMRAKLPFGQGIWPAFWTLGADIGEVGWPKCGEIDILEMCGGNRLFPNGDGRITANLHAATPFEKNELVFRLQSGRFCDDFHIFGVNWTEKQIDIYVDDVIFASWDIENIPEFHKPHYVLINIAVGGSVGSPDETTVFPQEYIVDWVRYYKG